jgi:hypothetical protein
MNKKGQRLIFGLSGYIWVPIALWLIAVTIFFDKFAYQIEAFDAQVRVLLTTGQKDVREFNGDGIPLSYSARNGEEFTSPFYVVHYGVMYSSAFAKRISRKRADWFMDDSIKYWNVPPNSYKDTYFKNSADWVVEHISFRDGHAHLLYNFDWPYRNYPNGGLKAPWWSGLTDGYAIVLLLRANDVYGGSKYMDAATELYKSVLTPIANGGSLGELNGDPWIEEYVDPRADPKKLSFVLNGMIYATYGIDAYERYTNLANPMAPKLYQSIANNLHVFDRGDWSEYDAIGNAANIKYHRVHVALLKRIESETEKRAVAIIRGRWKHGMNNAGYFWLLHGTLGVAKIQFIFEYLFVLLVFPVSITLFGLIRQRKSARF